MSLAPGRQLAHYTILAPLGAGAMGEVYRARDSKLGREVAIKVLPEHFADDEERLRRFEHEAQTLASLNHPNVAQIFGVDQVGDTCFLVLELVPGETLEERLKRGPLSPGEALDVCKQIAEGLEAAHEAGVIHRDLKPANVRLTPRGKVKVLDFGLAKTAREGHAGSAPDGALATEPGRLLGTPTYMAPEQARGKAIDERVDIWAFGCVLYECLTARRAFEGETLADVLAAVIEREPDWTKLPAATAAGVREVLERCLVKDPRARLGDIGAARTLLGGSSAEPSGPRALGRALVKPAPSPATPLLGREVALESAAARLRDGARVLTVTGYGGTGKTRFSIELFRRLASEYDGGAAFVSLASVTAAAEVLPTVASALDIAEAHGRSALEALVKVIGERRVLLVLDNLEQVLDAAGDLAALVARCPALQVIATSRAPLKIGAESEFCLPPLALPAEGAASLDALQECPSVALFLQRAEKIKPGFALTPASAATIAAICRRLDGLPLALELAAARVRILEPAALLARLDHALDLLTSGDRDLPLRQRTLRATISWSYSLLAAAEQRLLRRLSVFHEGWTLAAMEEIGYGADERPRALDELDSLVEKGLVRVLGSGARFALLETIRAFAAEQLHAGGEVNAIRNAHADHFLAFASEVDAGIKGTGQLEAVQRARADNANLHAALQWLTVCARAGDRVALEKGLLLAGHLNWFWHIGGQHLTARGIVDALLALADAPSRGRALARLTNAMISTVTGELERSLGEARGGYEDGRALGDEPITAEGTMFVGYCQLGAGRMAEARAALDEAIARSAGGVSEFIHALSLTINGMLLFATADLEAGLALVEQGRRIQERLGDHEGGGVGLSFLAQMTFAKGDHARALTLYRDALASFETIGDRPEIARVHCEMGWTVLAAADARAAELAFRLAVHAYEEVGSPRGTGLALLGLAAVAAAEGRTERAVAIAAAAHALSERAGVVVEHPMDPGVVGRIEALKASIPKGMLDGLVTEASMLSPAAVLALVAG